MTFRLSRVTAGYLDTVVLRDVSVVVPTGSVVALLGPNGAGKTTLLRVAGGLLRPTSGRIVLDDDELTGRPAEEFASRGVILIPEGRGVFPSLTVRENLTLFASSSADDAFDAALAAFPGLGQRLNQVAGTLSGGEQQMLALSRAYVRPAATVLLDEVSMGLAPIIVDEIYAALRALADTGRALLVVEQFAAKALAMADVVYVLSKGRISFAAEPDEIDFASLSESYLGVGVSQHP